MSNNLAVCIFYEMDPNMVDVRYRVGFVNADNDEPETVNAAFENQLESIDFKFFQEAMEYAKVLDEKYNVEYGIVFLGWPKSHPRYRPVPQSSLVNRFV